jgi:hypothetical protein
MQAIMAATAGGHGPSNHRSLGLHNFLGIMPSRTGSGDLVSGAGEQVHTMAVEANRSVKSDDGQRKRRLRGGFTVCGRGTVVAGGKLY